MSERLTADAITKALDYLCWWMGEKQNAAAAFRQIRADLARLHRACQSLADHAAQGDDDPPPREMVAEYEAAMTCAKQSAP